MLTVTSYANRTSPVIRGKWILANMLGTPPAPPPPGLPPLKDDECEREGPHYAGAGRAASGESRMRELP